MVTGHRRNAGIRAGGYFGGDLGFSKLLLGGSAGTPGPLWNEKGCGILGKRLRRPQDRSTAFLQWIMSKSACVDCKYAVNLAVAFGPVEMQ